MSFAKWRRRAASLSLSWRLALSAFFISLVTLLALLAAGFHAYTHMLEAEYVSQLDAYMVELSMLVDEVTEHPSQRQDEVMARWVHSELTNEHYTSLLADGEGQILDQSEHFPFSYSQFMEFLPQDSRNLVKEYDSLNHLFQHCTIGAVTEYRSIEETVSAELLADLAGWISMNFMQ